MSQKLHTQLKFAEPEHASALSKLFAASWRGAYRGIIPYQELEAIIKRRNTNWWAKALSSDNNQILIVFDNAIIGYAGIGPLRNVPTQTPATPIRKPVGEIIELYLEPDYQGLGFGRKLFTAAFCELRKRHMQELIVWALCENTNACEFYRHLEGEICAHSEQRFGSTKLKKIAFKWSL